jgi:hypothetical protein
MEKRKWRKEIEQGTRFRQSLVKPRIQKFNPEKNLPHGRETYQVLEYRKKKQEWVWATYTRFCSCRGCKAYLALLQQLNPARASELTENDGKPQDFKRPKGLPLHVHVRRRLQYSLRKW